MKIINYTPDPQNKAQLTKEQSAYLESLSDDTIDYSDIPELDEEFWENAQIVTEKIDLKKSLTESLKND